MTLAGEYFLKQTNTNLTFTLEQLRWLLDVQKRQCSHRITIMIEWTQAFAPLSLHMSCRIHDGSLCYAPFDAVA